MLAQSSELENVRLRIQEKVIKRVPEFERPLMEFTKILFEEWESIFLSASEKKPEINQSKQQNLNAEASLSVENILQSS